LPSQYQQNRQTGNGGDSSTQVGIAGETFGTVGDDGKLLLREPIIAHRGPDRYKFLDITYRSLTLTHRLCFNKHLLKLMEDMSSHG
jgi:hypothetical protein